jgi:hypothetical protein
VYNPDLGADHRRFPDFASFRMWYGKGFADYKGVNLGFRARGEKYELQGFYTYSESEGNILGGADEFRITSIDYQPDLRAVRDQSVNPYDPTCSGPCTGPLNTDATNRVTLSATYQLPVGFTVSGVFRYRSATPYTEWAGTDVNGDGYAFDLAPGVSHVNTRRGSSFSQLDLRVSKQFWFAKDIGLEILAEVFNVLNAKNPAGYVGNILASNYGQPTTYSGDPLQGEQRMLQLGARVQF